MDETLIDPVINQQLLWVNLIPDSLPGKHRDNKLPHRFCKSQKGFTWETEASRTVLGGKVDKLCDIAVSLNELTRLQTGGDWAASVLSLCALTAEPGTSQRCPKTDPIDNIRKDLIGEVVGKRLSDKAS